MLFKAWLFRTIGNISYRLNGGLEGLDRRNLCNKIQFWAWSKSYYAECCQEFPKGRKDCFSVLTII